MIPLRHQRRVPPGQAGEDHLGGELFTTYSAMPRTSIAIACVHPPLCASVHASLLGSPGLHRPHQYHIQGEHQVVTSQSRSGHYPKFGGRFCELDHVSRASKHAMIQPYCHSGIPPRSSVPGVFLRPILVCRCVASWPDAPRSTCAQRHSFMSSALLAQSTLVVTGSGATSGRSKFQIAHERRRT